jgi:hypothetical protein
MGFLSGRVTIARYRVTGQSPGIFGPEHLKLLADLAAGRQRIASADGIEIGWIAGDHLFDTRFELAKNVVNEALLFVFRIDALKIPADLKRAYYQIELEARSRNNPSGHPSALQKKEAREAAADRLENEAKDGRFTRRKLIPVMWDARSNEILVGTTSLTAIDQLHGLFERTFECGFEPLTAGRLAFSLAELRQQTRGVDDAAPSAYIPGLSPSELAWIPDEASRDFLGNEFLLWLWFFLETQSDTIKLADKSEATLMLARTLTLECPRGQTGYETITSEGPTRLPEARRAIQAGKLPRKTGITVVRHGQQFELTLQAETLAISAARLPAPEEEDERARQEERITQIRDLLETLDLIYDAYGRIRHGPDWPKELAKMQKWLGKEDRPRMSATG